MQICEPKWKVISDPALITYIKFFILVVCEHNADTTLIKLTLNVIHEEAKGDNDLQKSLRKSKGKGDLLAEAQEDSELAELFKRIKIAA